MNSKPKYCSLPRKKKLWIYDPCGLFNNMFNIIPNPNMSKIEKVNTLTRLVLWIFLILVFFKYPKSLEFLMLSIIIILLLYFITTKEGFHHLP